MKEFKYLAPRTLEEAIALKKEYGDAAKFIAGSTDVVVAMRDYKITPEYIIDLKKIPGMDQITWDEKTGLHIGALVTMDEIWCWSICPSWLKLPVLSVPVRCVPVLPASAISATLLLWRIPLLPCMRQMPR